MENDARENVTVSWTRSQSTVSVLRNLLERVMCSTSEQAHMKVLSPHIMGSQSLLILDHTSEFALEFSSHALHFSISQSKIAKVHSSVEQ